MKKVMSVLMAAVMLFAMYGGAFAVSYDKITPSYGDTAEMQGVAGNVVGTMQWVGYAIAVIMLVYIGIKYVMASANEKADLKSSLVKYVIGAVLIIFAVTIAGWVFSLGNE